MTTPIELYICKKMNNSLDNNLVWFRDKIVTNNYIYNHWKKKINYIAKAFFRTSVYNFVKFQNI